MFGKRQSARRTPNYGDPGVLQLAFGRNEYETQRDLMEEDLFLSGIAANRKYRERFIDDMADQQLIERSVPVEQLFHESVRDA